MMHRASGRVLKSGRVIGQARRASTATKAREVEALDDLPSREHRQHSSSERKANSTKPQSRRPPSWQRTNPMHWNRDSAPSLSSMPTIQRVAQTASDPMFDRPSLQGAAARDTHDIWAPRRGDRQQNMPSLPRSEQKQSGSTYTSMPQTQWDDDRTSPGSSRPRRGDIRDRTSHFSGNGHSRSSFRDTVGSAVNQKPTRQQAPKPKPLAKGPKTFKRSAVEVYIPSTVPVGTLSKILKVRLDRLQRRIIALGLTESPTYDYLLTADYASLLAEEFGRKPVIDDEASFDLYPPAPHPDPTSLSIRPPVVTIMGHVDHGKTTLLDTLRSSSVAKGEAGGITQHIGAFSVPVQTESGSSSGPGSITFLDTPGHAAFSAMRARGAGVTDIIVLVVAADDGIMPQTREVIELYKKCQDTVGLVVAINKVDKPSADAESVEKALMAEGIQLESYGGDIPAVHVSGLTGQGLPELIETLSAMAEMQDLRAEQSGHAYGEILESRVQKGLGFIATVLVMRGSLKAGSHILSGSHYAKVRIMTASTGAVVKVATPGMAVTVCGWKTLPKAGDNVIEGSEAEVKKAMANRIRQSEIEASLADVDAINETRKAERELREAELKAANTNGGRSQPNTRPSPIIDTSGPKELRLLIKADVSGSAEAIEGALQGIGNKIATSKITQTGVGDVTETDVMMAKTANATIVAFSVAVPRSIQNLAAQNGVPILESKIIYKLMDDVRDRVRALLPPIVETKVTGEANVSQIFEIQMKDKTVKKVAGCRVSNGLLEKSKHARVIRNGKPIFEGMLDTMRHLKKDVTEARKGTECGISLAGFDDLREGDMIQMFERVEKPGLL